MTTHSSSLDIALHEMLRKTAASERTRTLKTHSNNGVYVQHGGTEYLSFCSNDYLGIAQTLLSAPDLPIGSGASRLLTGNHPLYAEVEKTLATMKGTQAALLFGSGYLANIGTIPVLVGKDDVVLMDKASHACMIDGVRLSGAAWYRFRHNDMAHLEQLLAKHRDKHTRCLILTETVFSMAGDRAPLADIATLAETHDAWLMTDDAHGFGLPVDAPNPAHIQMGTLSKAAGCYGGYVCGSQALIDTLINHASPLIFSTALPPSLLQSIMDALELMQDEPERATQVMALATRLTDALDLPKAQSAIIPIILGDNEAALQMQNTLKRQGILVSAIRPPTVPEGTARLRISVSAHHRQADVDRLVEALKPIGDVVAA